MRSREMNVKQDAPTTCHIESAANLFSRSLDIPLLAEVHRELLPFVFNPGDIIKISYDDNAPRNIILEDIIVNAVLPKEIGGSFVDVAILHTDSNFDVDILTDNIKKKVEKFKDKNSDDYETTVKTVLEKLHIFRIYDSRKFLLTIHALEEVLLSKCKISLMIVDNILAFYWSDKMFSNIVTANAYASNILKLLYQVTKDYPLLILYMEPYFSTTKHKQGSGGKNGIVANHQVHIKRLDLDDIQNMFSIIVQSHGSPVNRKIEVKNKQIHWL